ncbi:MAG: hypothetical protein AB7D37_20115 [Desulfovibrio sp.]
MKKALCLCLLAGFMLAAVAVAQNAEARPPCPPGYFWDGPRGCMPLPYAPPPVYYPAPVYPAPVYPAPVYPACPPGTFWRAGACRPAPRPAPGIRVYLPPVYIGP